jgi:hypothetical protein
LDWFHGTQSGCLPDRKPFSGAAEVNPGKAFRGKRPGDRSIPFAQTLQRFLTPPIENQLVQEQARVQVLNGSNMPDADRLAAAR